MFKKIEWLDRIVHPRRIQNFQNLNNTGTIDIFENGGDRSVHPRRIQIFHHFGKFWIVLWCLPYPRRIQKYQKYQKSKKYQKYRDFR